MTKMPFFKKIGFTLMLLPICGILVIGISSIIYMSGSSHDIIDEVAAARSTSALTSMDIILDHYRIGSTIVANDLSKNAAIIQAIERADYAAIGDLAQCAIGHTGLSVNFVAFTDGLGNVIARTHSDRTGDSIAYQRNVSQALAGGVSTHIEPGSEIQLSIRTGAPIKNAQGETIGTVSTGYSMVDPAFVDTMKNMTGHEFTVFIGDERVSTTIAQNEQRAIATKMDPQIAKTVLEDKQSYTGEAVLFGIPYATAYRPIVDAEGNALGAFFAGTSLVQVNALRQKAMVNAVAIEIAIMVLVIVAFLLYVRHMVTSPLKGMARAAAQIKQGNLELEIQHQSQNELGILADALRAMVSRLRGYIKDLRQREEDLMIALYQARQAEETKSQFLANMSHEIRTPMNAIIGMAHLAQKTDLTPKQKDYIDKIQQSSTFLLGVINDILDFSKIESGNMLIEDIEFELENVLENSVVFISRQAHDKGLEFICRLSPDIPSHIKGDPLRLTEILSNLASNAVKFTEKGQVSIDVTAAGHSEGNILLRFAVSDTGIGMTDEQQRNLFIAFMQADSSTTRRFGGTGLGLAICKRLAELMGGTLEAASKQGEGSVFTFTAPFGIAAGSRPSKIMPYGMSEKRILVVDDNSAVRSLFLEYLSAMKFRAEAVCSGEKAVQAAQRADADDPYDVIFLDSHMQDMSGVQTAIRLKACLTHRPIMILLTVSEEEEWPRQSIDGALSKPISQSMLYDCLVNLFAPPREGAPERCCRSEKRYGLAGFRILLVEDNDMNLQIATELLQGQGVIVDAAKDGKQGLQLFKDAPLHAYHLVLMDLQMPEMDGFEAAGLIRRMDEHIPIIAMTARTMPEEKQRCFQCGMNDHIAKPIDADILFSTLSKWLTTHRAGTRRIVRDILIGGAERDAAQAEAGAERPEDADATIGRLLRLLQESDMEAVECFDAAKRALQSRMKLSDYIDLERSISRFEFLDAAKILWAATMEE